MCGLCRNHKFIEDAIVKNHKDGRITVFFPALNLTKDVSSEIKSEMQDDRCIPHLEGFLLQALQERDDNNGKISLPATVNLCSCCASKKRSDAYEAGVRTQSIEVNFTPKCRGPFCYIPVFSAITLSAAFLSYSINGVIDTYDNLIKANTNKEMAVAIIGPIINFALYGLFSFVGSSFLSYPFIDEIAILRNGCRKACKEKAKNSSLILNSDQESNQNDSSSSPMDKPNKTKMEMVLFSLRFMIYTALVGISEWVIIQQQMNAFNDMCRPIPTNSNNCENISSGLVFPSPTSNETLAAAYGNVTTLCNNLNAMNVTYNPGFPEVDIDLIFHLKFINWICNNLTFTIYSLGYLVNALMCFEKSRCCSRQKNLEKFSMFKPDEQKKDYQSLEANSDNVFEY